MANKLYGGNLFANYARLKCEKSKIDRRGLAWTSLVGEFGEPSLYQVDPGSVGGSEVDMKYDNQVESTAIAQPDFWIALVTTSHSGDIHPVRIFGLVVVSPVRFLQIRRSPNAPAPPSNVFVRNI
jgi:hypothetical protein